MRRSEDQTLSHVATRVEVITKDGRELVRTYDHIVTVNVSIQDDARTVKVFID